MVLLTYKIGVYSMKKLRGHEKEHCGKNGYTLVDFRHERESLCLCD